jgi:DNA-binding GntR family transcriptional regulator
MSPAHVLEPTYHSLKQRLLEGAWPIGLRLDATRLADDFGVSVTPVRDCLNRLVGERLVDFRAQEGYRVARVTERELRDMLAFVTALLDLALQGPPAPDPAPEVWSNAADHAGRTAALFRTIASRSGNAALRETVVGLGERLHAARRLETRLFADAEEELAELTAHLAGGNGALRRGLTAYHERRRNAASRLIELLEKRPI